MAKNKLQAVVISVLQKTLKVQNETQSRHPIYGKLKKVHKKFLADCASFELKPGDLVEITGVAPISKKKVWKVTKLVQK